MRIDMGETYFNIYFDNMEINIELVDGQKNISFVRVKAPTDADIEIYNKTEPARLAILIKDTGHE